MGICVEMIAFNVNSLLLACVVTRVEHEQDACEADSMRTNNRLPKKQYSQICKFGRGKGTYLSKKEWRKQETDAAGKGRRKQEVTEFGSIQDSSYFFLLPPFPSNPGLPFFFALPFPTLFEGLTPIFLSFFCCKRAEILSSLFFADAACVFCRVSLRSAL